MNSVITQDMESDLIRQCVWRALAGRSVEDIVTDPCGPCASYAGRISLDAIACSVEYELAYARAYSYRNASGRIIEGWILPHSSDVGA